MSMVLKLQKGIKATAYNCFCDKGGGGGNKATICPCCWDKKGVVRQNYVFGFSIKGGNNTIDCPRFCFLFFAVKGRE